MSFYSQISAFRPREDRAPRRWLFVAYDQLRANHPLLDGDPAEVGLIYIETAAKPERRPYHKQKLVLLLSAMRHHALGRAGRGHPVVYRFSQDWYDVALRAVQAEYGIGSIDALAPAERELRESLYRVSGLVLHPNPLFVTDEAFYREVFRGRRERRLETFYRAARRHTGLLMEGDAPVAGRWNFDEDNRRPWKGEPAVPARPRFAADAITAETIELVRTRYADSFGNLDEFDWPVTHEDAARLADHFFERLLPHFGPFEDAMHAQEHALFHSLLSACLNLGMLDPLALCRRAEQAYRDGRASLQSVEGFIRQILGWREFVRHVYEEHADEYARCNALGAELPLPAWFWGEPSGMNCVDNVVNQVIERGHSHHITRLMVLSNLATLLGVDPHALNRWFWIAYVDAFEWVVTPNVLGMGTYADGGIFATKPYVASGKYIQRMGPSLCVGCRFDPKKTMGADACPFNHLYWDFLERNRTRFARNPRMANALATLNRLSPETMADHREHARRWRERALASPYPATGNTTARA